MTTPDNLLPCPICRTEVGYRRVNQIHHPFHAECPLSETSFYNVTLWQSRTPPDSVNIKREVVEKLREEILWWSEEHGCCKGHEDEALALLDDALKGKT